MDQQPAAFSRRSLWLVAVAAVLLAFSAAALRHENERRNTALAETAHATGIVTHAGSCGPQPVDGIARFTVDGATYAARVDCSARVGAGVPVVYDPANPRHANDSPSTAGMAIPALLSALALGLLVRVLIWPRRRRSGPDRPSGSPMTNSSQAGLTS